MSTKKDQLSSLFLAFVYHTRARQTGIFIRSCGKKQRTKKGSGKWPDFRLTITNTLKLHATTHFELSRTMQDYISYRPYTATMAGFVIPMVTGSLSALSSGLILYVIFKSHEKLSTTYHRIMAFMSMFDIISSIFIALGTIMMPSDNIYKFAGPMLGNQVSCKVQGWLVVFGLTGSNALYASLAWYFVCNFTLKMSSSKITRNIEPIWYFYSFFLAFFVPSFYLSKDFLNPNSYDSFCTIVPYPESCDETIWYDWGKCSWADGVLDDYYEWVTVAVAIVALQTVLVVIGMSNILWIVYKNNQEIKTLLLMENEHSNQNLSPEIDTYHDDCIDRSKKLEDLQYARVLILQALMYIGAYFLTWSLNTLSVCFSVSSFAMDAINCILFPLQGFWNLIIFLYDKTYLVRQSYKPISFWNSVKLILFSPTDIPKLVLADISNVIIKPRRQEFEKSPSYKSENDSIPQNGQAPAGRGSMVSSLSEPVFEHKDDSNLRNENQRCNINPYRIRRTGDLEFRRQRPAVLLSSTSIDSPVGFVGDSIGSEKTSL